MLGMKMAFLDATVAALVAMIAIQPSTPGQTNEEDLGFDSAYLVPCLGYSIASTENTRKHEALRSELGLLERGRDGGRVVAEVLVLSSVPWAVTVQLSHEGAGRVVLSELPGDPAVAGGRTTQTTSIPRSLAVSIACAWRTQLHLARYPNYMLPLPDAIPGGCLDGTSYIFSYLGACAIPSCAPDKGTPSWRMLELSIALRSFVKPGGSDRPVQIERIESLAKSLCKSPPPSRDLPDEEHLELPE